MENNLTIAECRQILGKSASEFSDIQLENLRDQLGRIAQTLYEKIVEDSQTEEGIEALRWASYCFALTPEETDEMLRREAIEDWGEPW